MEANIFLLIHLYLLWIFRLMEAFTFNHICIDSSQTVLEHYRPFISSHPIPESGVCGRIDHCLLFPRWCGDWESSRSLQTSLASLPRGPSNQEGSGCPNHLCRSDSIVCRRWRGWGGEGASERERERDREREGWRQRDRERKANFTAKSIHDWKIYSDKLTFHPQHRRWCSWMPVHRGRPASCSSCQDDGPGQS